MKKTGWFGVYNENLKLVSEGLRPSWFKSDGPKPIFSKGQIISTFIPKNKPNTLRIYFSEIVESKTTIGYLQNKLDSILNNPVKSRTLSDYPKLKSIPDTAVLLIVPQASCPSCVSFSLTYFIEELESMEGLGVFLITDNMQALKLLDGKNSSHIIIDENQELQSYLSNTINNPTLMKWQGGKVTTTMVLPPNEVINLEAYIKYLLEN